MKKYYLTRIYQATEQKGYFTPGEEFKSMIVFKSPNEKYKLEASFTLEYYEKKIIVEKIFPYLVREIKTGIVFPVVNFKKRKYSSENASDYISYPFGLVHTFVVSREGELEATEVESSSELEKYNELNSDIKKLRDFLLYVINKGKTQMENKIMLELDSQYQKEKMVISEKQKVIDEHQKVRRMKRQFKKERKKV